MKHPAAAKCFSNVKGFIQHVLQRSMAHMDASAHRDYLQILLNDLDSFTSSIPLFRNDWQWHAFKFATGGRNNHSQMF